MAKMTLLEITQSVLNSMDSDFVTSIGDTEESNQVALVAKECYLELINREEWGFLKRGLTLTSPASALNPTQFGVPDNVRRLTYVGYNVAASGDAQYRELKPVSLECFLQDYAYETTESVAITYPNGLKFFVRSDRMPSVYTTIDDQNIIVDSFDGDVDTYLTLSKLSAFGFVIPSFDIEDDFVPDLPTHMFPLYLAEVKNNCHRYFKQAPSAMDERKTLRQLAQARRQDTRILTKHDYYKNRYGRNR